MPIYEFICDNCKKCFEKLRKSIEYDSPVECPNCCSQAKRVPSVFSAVITESSRSQLEQDNSTQNRKQPSGTIDFSNTVNSSIKDCSFQNVDRAVYFENATNLKVENLTFDNVRIGIEHKNSDFEVKNLKSKMKYE